MVSRSVGISSAAIITIGDELLIGQVVNTNASWLGEALTTLGYEVRRVVVVGDRLDDITQSVIDAARENSVVVLSGGLGPTHDDLTRQAICELLGCDLTMDAVQLERIEQRFRERGVELNERSRRQALVPSKCDRLLNDYGSAPGLHFNQGEADVYVLPGVPSEMRGIFTDHIAPVLATQVGDVDRETFLLFGVTESALADALHESESLLGEGVSLAYLPGYGGIRLRAMRRSAEADVVDRYNRLLQCITTVAAKWLVSDRDEPLTRTLGRALHDAGLTLATAESCTGGLIGELVTSEPGSSAWYLGGVVSYSNSVKINILGVDAALIDRHGAVSREVAEAMAVGARERLGADLAVSVTGIAGPGGGTPEKPVGTVWIAVASKHGVSSRHQSFGGERRVTRERAAYAALDMVRTEALKG
jgi:nicotinamide-nucleotide amidase